MRACRFHSGPVVGTLDHRLPLPAYTSEQRKCVACGRIYEWNRKEKPVEILAALQAVLMVAAQVENGLPDFYKLVASLHAGGALSVDDLTAIRAQDVVDDAAYDAEIEAAKARLGK